MIIYYASYLRTGNNLEVNLSFTEPEKVENFTAKKDYFTNLYTINSQYNYDLFWNNDQTEIKSSYHDQKYFEKFVRIRSLKEKLFSLEKRYLFIPECDELFLTQESCLYKSNSFINNTVIIPGTFDIAKWPRPIEMPFHLIGNGFEIKQGDPLFSLKFHTKEKIEFRRFLITDEMINFITHMIVGTAVDLRRLKDLQTLYDIFFNKNKKFKKMMLNEAKRNLLS